MLIGHRLKNEHFLQTHVVYDLRVDGRDVGRFTCRPNALWNEVVLGDRVFSLGCERASFREGLARIFVDAPAKPFTLRDEQGRTCAQAQPVNSRTCSFERAGRAYIARMPWSWRHSLSIKDGDGIEIGSIRFRKVDGARQVAADLPADFELPLQVLLIGVLHDLIERNQSSGD
jgi:hypothetical protein